MGLRMKNVNILGVHRKIWLIGAEFTKNKYRGGNCLKRGAWTVYGFKGRGGGGGGKKEGVVFSRGGWYPNAHYAWARLWTLSSCNTKTISPTLKFVFPLYYFVCTWSDWRCSFLQCSFFQNSLVLCWAWCHLLC